MRTSKQATGVAGVATNKVRGVDGGGAANVHTFDGGAPTVEQHMDHSLYFVISSWWH